MSNNDLLIQFGTRKEISIKENEEWNPERRKLDQGNGTVEKAVE